MRIRDTRNQRKTRSNADAVAQNNGTASFMPPPFQLKGAEMDSEAVQQHQQQPANLTAAQRATAIASIRNTYDLKSIKTIQSIVGTTVDGAVGNGTVNAIYQWQLLNNAAADLGRVQAASLNGMVTNLVTANQHDFAIQLVMDFHNYYETNTNLLIASHGDMATAGNSQETSFELNQFRKIVLGDTAFTSYTTLNTAISNGLQVAAPQEATTTALPQNTPANQQLTAVQTTTARDFNTLLFDNNSQTIHILQNILGLHGTDNDGDAGSTTSRYVADYQRRNSITIDGKLNEATITHIVDALLANDNIDSAIPIVADFYGIHQYEIANKMHEGDNNANTQRAGTGMRSATINDTINTTAALLAQLRSQSGGMLGAPQNGPTNDPLADMSILQSPGGSAAAGARYGVNTPGPNVVNPMARNSGTRAHRGADIHAKTGTPVFAALAGTVTHRVRTGYGHCLELVPTDATSQQRFRYAHLSNVDIGATGHSWTVAAGDIIGYTGISGTAQANRAHLHFEVFNSGNFTGGQQVDPDTYFSVGDKRRETDENIHQN